MIVDKVRVQSRASKTSFEGETSVNTGAKGRSGGGTSRKTSDKPAAPRKRKPANEEESANSGPKIIGNCPRPGCGGMILWVKKATAALITKKAASS